MVTASIYHPLDDSKRQIRLLWINRTQDTEPGSGVGKLVCNLETFSLHDQPQHEALSYTWGQEHATCAITINNETFLIRPNLHSLLQQYCHRDWRPPVRDDTGWIFIDAICINQDDVAERDSQVTLMGDVYRQATGVIAWLGDGTQAQGMSRIPMANDFHSDALMWRKHFDGLRDQYVFSAAIRLAGLPPYGSLEDMLKSLGVITVQGLLFPLLRQAFWSRLWTVQEIILAQNLVFWYGEIRVPWEILHECLKFAYKKLFQEVTRGRMQQNLRADVWASVAKDNQDPLKVLYLLQAKVDLAEQARARKVDLSSAILTFVGQECSINKDKVYGLLGMTPSIVPVRYEMEESFIFTCALMEGLLEIAYAYENDNKQRAILSAEYTVALARTLNIDIHGDVNFEISQHCLSLVGQRFKNTSTLWIRVQHLDLPSLMRFGSLGQRVYKSLPELMHGVFRIDRASLKAIESLSSSKTVNQLTESVCIGRCAAVLQGRFFERWRLNDLIKVLPDLPRMTSQEDVEVIIQKILQFPDPDAKARMIKEARQYIENERSSLHADARRMDQEQVRRLHNVIAMFDNHTATSAQRTDTLSDTSTDSQPSSPSPDPQTIGDLQTVIQFIHNPKFNSYLIDSYGNDRNFLMKFQLYLYEALRQNFHITFVVQYVARRTFDNEPGDEFGDFMHRMMNTYVRDGEIEIRRPDDPDWVPELGSGGRAINEGISMVTSLLHELNEEVVEDLPRP